MSTPDVTVDINGNRLSYMNDPKLHRGEIKFNLNEDQVKEIYKCSQDIVYFAENYIYIQDPNEGLKLVELYEYQKDILNQYTENKYNIVMSARQSGKSTISGIYLVWYSIFNADKMSAILANKGSVAREIFGRCLDMFRLLPHFMKPGVYEFNKSSISLDNGSGLIASASSKDSIRGYTINGTLFLDEVAFHKNWDEFYTSVYPTISAARDSKIILVSTPKGMNHFYRLWKNAIDGISNYVPYLVTWDKIPGRDENWKTETIKALGSIEKFKQEQECKFIGSSDALFSYDILNSLKPKNPIKSLYDNCFQIYEDPQHDRKYFISVDVSEGKKQDYSIINILDITDVPVKQIALYRSNNIDIRSFAYTLNSICNAYNNPFLLIENNGSGKLLVDIMYNEIEYENMYFTNKDIGLRTTIKTKRIGIETFKSLIEQNGIDIIDFDTIKEMGNFTKLKTSYSATAGETDDIVMTFINYAYLTTKNVYREITDDKFQKELYEQKMNEIYEYNKTVMYSSNNINEWNEII